MTIPSLRSRVVATALAVSSVACGPGVKEFLLGPSPTPSPSPVVQATPIPVAATPAPTPEPPVMVEDPYPEPSPDSGEDIPNNTEPVVKVGAKVFFVECNGGEVRGSEEATEAPVGCRLHMDCTAKDRYNKPTRAQGYPSWSLSDPTLVSGGSRTDYTPVFTIRKEGVLTLYVVIDRVRSNDVTVRFVN